jgi:hypothetical protein
MITTPTLETTPSPEFNSRSYVILRSALFGKQMTFLLESHKGTQNVQLNFSASAGVGV